MTITENNRDDNPQKPNGDLRVYTFADVAQHNTSGSSWCVVRGRVLDLTKFLSKHPGGSQIILASGIDATVLVDSYHPNGVSDAVLDKLTIGRVAKSVSYYHFDNRPEAFYPTLKRRVHEHLRKLGVTRRGSLEIHIKAAIIFSTLIASYVCGWLLPDISYTTRALFAVIHGIAAAHVGMSVMHDANHGAFSKSSEVNSVLGATLDLIGASGCVWSFQHVVSHHAFTNLETRTERNLEAHRNLKSGSENKSDLDLQLSHENDVDVFSSYPMVRMHPADERHWYHSYQHIYAPFLFGLFTLVKIFYSDLQFYLAGRVAHVSMKPRMVMWREHLVFVGLKLFNMTIMLAVPILLQGWEVAVFLLVIAHFVAGEYLAICFIVSHISEAALFFRGGKELGVEGADSAVDENIVKSAKVHPRDWAALQGRTTVNWASESWFWGAFSGGLNTQYEHHVFPGVNHTAYRFMPPIMREVCKEFNVPYIEVPTLLDAVKLCMRYLKALGEEDMPSTGIEMAPVKPL